MTHPVTASPISTEVVVIGAGPVGLYQAFQLGLQGVDVHVVDVLPQAGGQCTQLYPDKPIYDIPALPTCSGRELTQRLLQQLEPLRIPLHLGQLVTGLQQCAETDTAATPGAGSTRYTLETDGGLRFSCRALVIAAGVGAFLPRPVPLPALQAWEGSQVFYHDPDATAWQGRQAVVMGGGTAAVALALRLADEGADAVTLLHRSERFDIEDDLDEQLQSAIGAGWIRLCLGQPVDVVADANGRLQALVIATADDRRLTLALDLLLPRLGLHPRLGPIAQWGLALERKHVAVDTEHFRTSVPGIYAVGDVNTYPGKRKLIVCGFHEATLAALSIVQWLHPNERFVLEYTTTSERLQRRLGVLR
jgi:thioredoxin reductase (NADPH)